MRFVICTALILGIFAAHGAGQQPQGKSPPALKDLRAKASYAIGMNIGKSLKQDGVDPDLEAFAKGLADATSGAKPLLTPAEMKDVMAAFQRELAAAQSARRKVQSDKNQKEGAAFLSANKKKEGVKTTASGLQYKVLRDGAGKTPKISDTVKAHYRGTLLDGTEFDSSYARGEPTPFQVGGVIPGWTEALQLMKVGSKWQIFVPSNLAYDADGSGPDIGPHATLVFEIELVGIEGSK